MVSAGRRQLLYRILVILLALPHFWACIPLPLSLYGLVVKLSGAAGHPLDISGHPPRFPKTDEEIVRELVMAFFVSLAGVLYGAFLVLVSVPEVRKRRAVVVTSWALAAVCTSIAIAFYVYIVATSAASERDEMLFGGGLMVLGYVGCNAVVVMGTWRRG